MFRCFIMLGEFDRSKRACTLNIGPLWLCRNVGNKLRTNETNIPKMEDLKLSYCSILHISVYDTNYSARLVLLINHLHGEDLIPGKLVPKYQYIRPHNPEEHKINLRRSGNFITWIIFLKKVQPRRRGKQGYSSILSSTSAVEGVGGQRHVAARIPPGITRYPLYRRLGGLQDVSARLRISRPPRPPGFDPRTVQPVARGYTNWAPPVWLIF
jgi:hypothetical protein